MKPGTPLEAGDLVQLSYEGCGNPMFEGCFMVVTEVKSFGAMGYVQSLGKEGKRGGPAYYRAAFAEFEYVGRARWVVE